MVSMDRHHDMAFVPMLMLMPIKSASLFSQPFPECGTFHSVLLTRYEAGRLAPFASSASPSRSTLADLPRFSVDLGQVCLNCSMSKASGARSQEMRCERLAGVTVSEARIARNSEKLHAIWPQGSLQASPIALDESGVLLCLSITWPQPVPTGVSASWGP
jgi:hypothetical protein